jgi:hypothetical protein
VVDGSFGYFRVWNRLSWLVLLDVGRKEGGGVFTCWEFWELGGRGRAFLLPLGLYLRGKWLRCHFIKRREALIERVDVGEVCSVSFCSFWNEMSKLLWSSDPHAKRDGLRVGLTAHSANAFPTVYRGHEFGG